MRKTIKRSKKAQLHPSPSLVDKGSNEDKMKDEDASDLEWFFLELLAEQMEAKFPELRGL
ncbi:hypothetical protein [Flavitalea sp.]|nr:hypothetical protein [Flavitalea sp.]